MDRFHHQNITLYSFILFSILILSTAGILIPFVLGKSNFSLLGLYIAVPAIFASLFYIRLRHAKSEQKNLQENSFRLYICLFFFLFSASVFAIYFNEVRPVIYYFIIASISAVILYEILFFHLSYKRNLIILFQIVLLNLNILWGVTINYHYFISRTDPLAHVWFLRNLIDLGHVSAVFSGYQGFPLWHILVSATFQLIDLDLPVQKVMFIVGGLVYAFILVISYIIGLKLFNEGRNALLTTLFVCFFPIFISYGLAAIPRSITPLFFLLIIFVLLSKKNNANGYLLIILVVATVILHHASAPFILLIFCLIYILQYLYNSNDDQKIMDSKFLVTIIIFTLAYWIYASNYIFEAISGNIIKPGFNSTYASGVFESSDKVLPINDVLSQLLPLNELINYLQYSPIIFFTIFGILYLLDGGKISLKLKWFCILGILFLPVVIPGPVLLIDKLAKNFSIERLGTYSFFFISCIGAVGLSALLSKLKGHYKIFVIILFAILCFLAVSNDFNASDNPLVKRPFFTFYLTEEEETAFNSIANIQVNGYIFSDYVTTRYYGYSEFSENAHILEMNINSNQILTNSMDDIELFRLGEWNKRPLNFYSTEESEFISYPSWNKLNYFTKGSYFYIEKNSRKIYNSGSVIATTLI